MREIFIHESTKVKGKVINMDQVMDIVKRIKEKS